MLCQRRAAVVRVVMFRSAEHDHISMSSDFSRDLLSLLAKRVQGTELLTGAN